MAKGSNMNKDVDMGVYGDQRRDMFGYRMLCTESQNRSSYRGN